MPRIGLGCPIRSLMVWSLFLVGLFQPARCAASSIAGSTDLSRWEIAVHPHALTEHFVRTSAGAQFEDPYPGLNYSVSNEPIAAPSTPEMSVGRMYLRGWTLITGVEFVLLSVTATLPKEWTGWSSTFIQDGLENLGEAYTMPPVWDDDHWFHNYIGHPYGGSVYYNTVRCQGADPAASFVFSTLMSLQWEYVFEAVAERPSIQDLIITPISGAFLGEMVHQLTSRMREGGTNLLEDVVILILNPTSIVLGR